MLTKIKLGNLILQAEEIGDPTVIVKNNLNYVTYKNIVTITNEITEESHVMEYLSSDQEGMPLWFFNTLKEGKGWINEDDKEAISIAKDCGGYSTTKDWIIRDQFGIISTCSNIEFEKRYELLND